MAENKAAGNLSGNLGAGAGIFAKRVQRTFSRAQEKVTCLDSWFIACLTYCSLDETLLLIRESEQFVVALIRLSVLKVCIWLHSKI